MNFYSHYDNFMITINMLKIIFNATIFICSYHIFLYVSILYILYIYIVFVDYNDFICYYYSCYMISVLLLHYFCVIIMCKALSEDLAALARREYGCSANFPSSKVASYFIVAR
jgi:hypothetical protein